jgi:hypothetical protein
MMDILDGFQKLVLTVETPRLKNMFCQSVTALIFFYFV